MPESSTSPAERGPARAVCGRCGQVIGVYEPMVACEEDVCRITSRARERGEVLARAALYHRSCWEAAQAEPRAG